MFKRDFLKVLTTTLCFGMLGGAALSETTAEKGLRIARLVDADEPGFRDQAVSGEMILRAKNGQTSIRRFHAKAVDMGASDSSRSLLVFGWPGDIRNTALLTHANTGGRDDNQWLYLPAISKVRRISSSGRSGSFVGSEFAYEDMVDQDVEKFSYNWIQDVSCSAGECYVIDRFPKTKSAYSYQRVWIAKSDNKVRRVEYYDRRKALLKTMTVSKYKKHQGKYLRAGLMEMTNHLTGKSTTLSWKDFKFNQNINPNELTVNALRRLN